MHVLTDGKAIFAPKEAAVFCASVIQAFIFTSLWGGTLCQNDGKALISPLSIVAAPLPGPKPMVISLLEEGEEPWIPDLGSPEAVAGDVSPAGAGIRSPGKGLQKVVWSTDSVVASTWKKSEGMCMWIRSKVKVSTSSRNGESIC
ncbi:UNVERIFIED_CONTAM: hypothetical protein H355_003968 [Colinus virginianus]|nr:hypothetical protein H355_003968 [Colinus virginianus]